MERKPRCERCYLHLELCICSLLPTIPLATRVVVLMHFQERHKTSNTGKLALLTLPNSELRFRGAPDGTPLSLDGLIDEEYETWLLHLNPNAVDVETAAASRKKPVRLLVPDGTWSQASRTGSKLAKALPVKSVTLRAGPPSRYKLRTEWHPDGMATFEAIARTLGVLEGAEVRRELEKVFDLMVERVLKTRGKV